MATRLNNPAIQHFDKSTSAPLAGGQMFFYNTGTTSFKTIYTDEGENFEAANPMVLDANGFEQEIFGTGAYRIVLINVDGVQQWERDPVNFDEVAGQFSQWLSSINYSINDVVQASDGNYYISIQNNNQARDPTGAFGPFFWTQFDFLKRWNSQETYQVNDVVRSITSGGVYTAVLSQSGNNPDFDDGTNWKLLDNIRIDDNTISATNTNGNIVLAPNGLGAVTTDNLSFNGNTISITNANGDLNLNSNGTGDVLANGLLVGTPQITQQVFFADGTWNRPANVKYVMVELIGGGGGGASSGTTANRGGGGGGAGAYCRTIVNVQSIASSPITVGLAGGSGVDGTQSSASALTSLIAFGGSGAIGSFGGFGGGVFGAGPGRVTSIGGDGHIGFSTLPRSGAGGASYFGGGVQGNFQQGAGTNADAVGTGGAGGVTESTTNFLGGTGAPGMVIITEYR